MTAHPRGGSQVAAALLCPLCTPCRGFLIVPSCHIQVLEVGGRAEGRRLASKRTPAVAAVHGQGRHAPRWGTSGFGWCICSAADWGEACRMVLVEQGCGEGCPVLSALGAATD